MLAVAATAAALIGSTGSAAASTALGETFAATIGCDAPGIWFQAASPDGRYAAPSNGVITQWSFQAGGSVSPLKFKVARPLGGNAYLIVGESGLETIAANTLNQFATRIPVQAGDIIGIRNPNFISCERTASAQYEKISDTVDPAPGDTFFPVESGNSLQIDVGAAFEPDCDSDGFGDESQDPDTSSCTDTVPPETAITKHPKNKTKKKKATFEFTSSEPASSFECSLDDAAFSACTPPLTVKVNKGKHTFAVRAKDAAGNIDAFAATDSWRVKRERRS